MFEVYLVNSNHGLWFSFLVAAILGIHYITKCQNCNILLAYGFKYYEYIAILLEISVISVM